MLVSRWNGTAPGDRNQQRIRARRCPNGASGAVECPPMADEALAVALKHNLAVNRNIAHWCTWCGTSSNDPQAFMLGQEVRGVRPVLCTTCGSTHRAGDRP